MMSEMVRRLPILDIAPANGRICAVGLSRQHTAENQRPRTAESQMVGIEAQKTITNGDTYGLQTQKTLTNGRLFTEDELANAMSQSTINVSKRERD